MLEILLVPIPDSMFTYWSSSRCSIKWLQGNGNKIEISKMEKGHIYNCLNILNDKANRKIGKKYANYSKKSWITFFNTELQYRKENEINH